MTDRRSFLAKLLCLPAVGKALAGSIAEAKVGCASITAFDPLVYAGEWKWYHIEHRAGPPPSWFLPLEPGSFPHGMGNTVRTPYDDQP